MSSLYKPKSPKSIYHNVFYYRCYINSLCNIVIFNLITSNLTTHPTQCPNHLSLFTTTSSIIGVTSTLCVILSILILLRLILPHIQHNIIISAKLTIFLCWSLTTQHFISYNVVGLTVGQ